MAETNWDDVGRHFADLGRKLQGAWEDARDTDAADDVKDAGDKVKAAMQDVAEKVQKVTASPDLHDTAKKAGMSVADALATTLHQVADLIASSASKRAGSSSPADAKPDEDDGPRELSSSVGE